MTAEHASTIDVAIHGATGRMGRILRTAIAGEDDIRLVAMAGRSEFLGLSASGDVDQAYDNLTALLVRTRPDVIVDFSSRDAVLALAKATESTAANVVTGTSGLIQSDLDELRGIAEKFGKAIMVGPNFSLGAVVLEHAVREAARHFDHAEIIEMHHAGKADAPSGSAMATARTMVEGRGGKAFTNAEPKVVNVPDVRGGDIDGVAIHSVRMPGLMAHQQVMLGGPGETLTFRHDVIDRESYMPGVLLAIREIGNRTGKLTYGLGALLWPEREKE